LEEWAVESACILDANAFEGRDHMLGLVLTVAAALSGDPAPTGIVSCELLKVRDEERQLGAMPALGEADSEGAAPPDQTGVLHFLTLRCDGRRYVARLAGELPRLDTVESNPRGLKVRFEANRVFFKVHGGKELEAGYVSAERSSRVSRPAAPQKH
jgi:hypothetical protein